MDATRSDHAAGSPRTLFDDFWGAFILLVALRLILGLVALYVWFGGGIPGPCHFELARDGWQTVPPLADSGASFPLIGVWQRWDACWYTKIATFGYESGTDSGNFFPLFPLLTAIAGRLLFGQMALGGLVVAGIAFVVAVAGILRLVGRDFDRGTAERTVILMVLWPAAFFMFAPFTETVFLAAAVWAIVGARERRWSVAIIGAMLAGLARYQGIIVVLPIAWEAAMWLRELRQRGSPPNVDKLVGPTAAILAPIIALLVFAGLATAWTGQSPFESQQAWGGSNFHPPWETVIASWNWALDHQDALQLLNLVVLLGALVLAVAGVRSLPFSYSLFALPQIAILAVRIQPTPLTSTVRYLLVVFPVFVVLALLTEDRRRFAAIALLSALFLALLFVRFLHGEFVA